MNSYTGSAFCRYNIFIPSSLNATGTTVSAPATLSQIPTSQALGPINSINPMKTSAQVRPTFGQLQMWASLPQMRRANKRMQMSQKGRLLRAGNPQRRSVQL